MAALHSRCPVIPIHPWPPRSSPGSLCAPAVKRSHLHADDSHTCLPSPHPRPELSFHCVCVNSHHNCPWRVLTTCQTLCTWDLTYPPLTQWGSSFYYPRPGDNLGMRKLRLTLNNLTKATPGDSGLTGICTQARKAGFGVILYDSEPRLPHNSSDLLKLHHPKGCH